MIPLRVSGQLDDSLDGRETRTCGAPGSHVKTWSRSKTQRVVISSKDVAVNFLFQTVSTSWSSVMKYS